MATNRKRIKRNFKIKLPSAMKEFLLYGTNSTDDFNIFLISIRREEIKEQWEQHKDELLRDWKKDTLPYAQKLIEGKIE